MKDVFDLGLEVDKLREKAGLTQKELADRARVNISTLSAIIRGGSIPRERTLRALAEVLPLKLEAWLEPVRQYQLKARRNAQKMAAEKRRHARETREQRAGAPVARQKYTGPSIGEICKRARAAGMTYGEYMAKHPYL